MIEVLVFITVNMFFTSGYPSKFCGLICCEKQYSVETHFTAEVLYFEAESVVFFILFYFIKNYPGLD